MEPQTHQTTTFPDTREDQTAFEAMVAELLKGEPFLPEEVRCADLAKYPEHQLEGRLAFYEREAVFEPNPKIRVESKKEVLRTKIELNRRKMYQRKEADRVFAL